VAEHLLVRPGEEADLLARLTSDDPGTEPSAAVATALREAGEGLVVLSGPRLAESEGAVAAAAALAASLGGRFAHLSRRAGDRGALAAGVHPALLPGGRPAHDADARADVERVWGAGIPAEPGRDAAAILDAAANRELDVLFLIGVDVLRDFPDAALARRALENVPNKVIVDIAGHGMARYADAILPAASSIEKDATYTDWEGRRQRATPVRDPVGLSRPDWQLLQELSEAMGRGMGLRTLEDLREESSRLLATTGDAATTGSAAAAGRQPPPPTARGRKASPKGDRLLLFTYPLLVDEGRLVEGADALKEAQEEPAFVEVHRSDADRLGLRGGDLATVTTEAGSSTVPVRVTDGVAPGCVFVPWNNPGLAANTLLSGSRIAAATLSKAAAEVIA
jgi:NADH-quinone oxidoreductase subunit G